MILEWERHSGNWERADRLGAGFIKVFVSPEPRHWKIGRLPMEFLRSAESDVRPPMVKMAMSNETSLKLFLWLWWRDLHQNDPARLGLRQPHREWADLLGLDDPKGRGARSVRTGWRWLEEHGFVSRNDQSPAKFTALSPTGNRGPTLAPKSGGDHEKYVGLPPGFWASGHLTRLSPRATVALLIVLNCAPRHQSATQTILSDATFVSESLLKQRYGMGREYFHKGIAELVHHRIAYTRLTRDWDRNPAGESSGFGGKETRIAVEYLRSGTPLAIDQNRLVPGEGRVLDHILAGEFDDARRTVAMLPEPIQQSRIALIDALQGASNKHSKTTKRATMKPSKAFTKAQEAGSGPAAPRREDPWLSLDV